MHCFALPILKGSVRISHVVKAVLDYTAHKLEVAFTCEWLLLITGVQQATESYLGQSRRLQSKALMDFAQRMQMMLWNLCAVTQWSSFKNEC